MRGESTRDGWVCTLILNRQGRKSKFSRLFSELLLLVGLLHAQQQLKTLCASSSSTRLLKPLRGGRALLPQSVKTTPTRCQRDSHSWLCQRLTWLLRLNNWREVIRNLWRYRIPHFTRAATTPTSATTLREIDLSLVLLSKMLSRSRPWRPLRVGPPRVVIDLYQRDAKETVLGGKFAILPLKYANLSIKARRLCSRYKPLSLHRWRGP